MAHVLLADSNAYKDELANRLFQLEANMNTKFSGLEGQSMQFLTQAENIKTTQAAAQQNLINSIEFEIDKTSKAVAEMKINSNQTLEDIKK